MLFKKIYILTIISFVLIYQRAADNLQVNAWNIQNCFVLRKTVFYCNRSKTLCNTLMQCSSKHYTTLNFDSLHYITLHYNVKPAPMCRVSYLNTSFLHVYYTVFHPIVLFL